jgi:hypothetical protein
VKLREVKGEKENRKGPEGSCVPASLVAPLLLITWDFKKFQVRPKIVNVGFYHLKLNVFCFALLLNVVEIHIFHEPSLIIFAL